MQDQHCQWVSQWRFASLATALYPEHTLLTHGISVENPHHAAYSKSRCLELMKQVTQELRESDRDFESCYVEPSNQALILDGRPRLSAYLPWFSAKPYVSNYSLPLRQSCDAQPVVLAMTATETYSWCRGCPLSVAFAVLQTIVAARPFEFQAWVRFANLLATVTAQVEDLVVSHVALTIATRLLWCGYGFRGRDIHVKERAGEIS